MSLYIALTLVRGPGRLSDLAPRLAPLLIFFRPATNRDTSVRIAGFAHRQGRKIINPSDGYPPDILRFVANERRDPVDIQRISTGGIYDFPAQVFRKHVY